MPDHEYEILVKSPQGDQKIRLQAASDAEAELAVHAHLARRQARFPLTFARLDASLEKGELTAKMHAAQVELRKMDQGRKLTVATIKKVS